MIVEAANDRTTYMTELNKCLDRVEYRTMIMKIQCRSK